MVSTTTSQPTKRTNGAPAVTTLDDLSKMTGGELAELYARAKAPDSLAALDGDLTGRMLAIRGLDRGAPFHLLTSMARSVRFPWAGKSFRSNDAQHGAGVNRIDFGRKGGRHRLFPFETRIGASVVDDRPAVVLDYDLPENPPMIRAIHDEVREVSPRVFLGPACMKRDSGRPTIVLWFALDAHR